MLVLDCVGLATHVVVVSKTVGCVCLDAANNPELVVNSATQGVVSHVEP
jgi:hypothetical protein